MKQCVGTEGVAPDYIRTDILPEFFRNFWVRRMASDRRNYRALVETTVELANKVGASEIVGRIVEDLKDENEQYRRMVVETIDKVRTSRRATPPPPPATHAHTVSRHCRPRGVPECVDWVVGGGPAASVLACDWPQAGLFLSVWGCFLGKYLGSQVYESIVNRYSI